VGGLFSNRWKDRGQSRGATSAWQSDAVTFVSNSKRPICFSFHSGEIASSFWSSANQVRLFDSSQYWREFQDAEMT
jgi:hypothetical protein